MVSSLYVKCSEFQKLAEDVKVSVEKNSDPTLQELSKIKSIDDRIEFAKKHWKFLGEGSSRTAFEINDKLVIKVAHNDKGIAQNKVEMDPKAQRSCTNPIIVADAEGKWIVIRNTEPLTEKEFKKMVGFGFESFMNALFYKFNNESNKWNPPHHYEEIEKNDLFNCIAELIFKTDQQCGDIDKISSWRKYDDQPILADYGLSRDVYRSYYRDSDSSSSSSSTTKTSE
jgi:hypothetical protein